MSTPDEKFSKNPWLQAGRFAFVVLYGVVIISALKWATNNIQQVLPSQRAVVWRTGGINRVHNAGLLLAWPKPIERVVMIPSAEAVLERKVVTAMAPRPAPPPPLVASANPSADEESGDSIASTAPGFGDAEAGAGYLLTGDAGIVRLEVTVFFAVRNPYEYALQTEHVLPALDRLVSRSAVLVCASRDLDTILVARPELLASDAGMADQRERLRSDLVRTINRALESLTAGGVGLGIEILRVDVQSKLPEEAISAFEEVLTATQSADQEIASAQTTAAYTSQEGAQAADRILQLAQAQASERLSKAESDTIGLQQLEKALKEHTEPGLMMRIYRERINAILAKAGSTTLLDPKEDSRLILDGAKQ
jgi:regulator of protease activity HflC (stomatin/prohibitin superfamily)